MYTVKKIIDLPTWDAFVTKQEFSPFVQSYHYGEFYESLKENFEIFGIYKGDVLVGGSIILSTHAKRGRFLYLPYGPILDFSDKEMVQTFCDFLKAFAKERKYDFIRVSPLLDDTQEGRDGLKKCGFRKAPMHVLAETSWILDLSPSEEELLAGMKKNHRNLIRRCEREGVRVEVRTDQEALDLLNEMHDVTEKKHNFRRFPKSYIEKEFNAFAKDSQAAIYLAYLPDGRLDAASIMMFFGNMAVYRHSASLNQNKKLPTSYLIQWQVIKDAKARGQKWYNFWGVAPEGSTKKHPFAGITHFKKGFGGMQKDLLQCHDLPITNKYWFNWMIETIRRIKRGF